MNIKSLTLWVLLGFIPLLSACQDKQTQAESDSDAAMKSFMKPTNTKLLSDAEIAAKLQAIDKSSDKTNK